MRCNIEGLSILAFIDKKFLHTFFPIQRSVIAEIRHDRKPRRICQQDIIFKEIISDIVQAVVWHIVHHRIYVALLALNF